MSLVVVLISHVSLSVTRVNINILPNIDTNVGAVDPSQPQRSNQLPGSTQPGHPLVGRRGEYQRKLGGIGTARDALARMRCLAEG